MNYFVTHSDKNYLKYAERLFESMQQFSDAKIIYYTVDFHYTSKYSNVIPVHFSTKDYVSSSSYNKLDTKSCFVFLKPVITEITLQKYAQTVEDSFCYIDCDCLARKQLDDIFQYAKHIDNYPLLNRSCFDYLIFNGRGDPFVNGGFDINKCLEAELLKALNIDLNLRTQTYVQTGVFIFNNKCLNFLKEWKNTCFLDFIFENQFQYAPFHEETVINCLLWKYQYKNNLSQVLINIPYCDNKDFSKEKILKMQQALSDTKNNGYLLTGFTYIPSKQDVSNLYFYHGKISDEEYNLFRIMSERLLLKIHSPSLGDTIACTPTLRKLYKSYGKKITVATHHKELFKNNQYVDECFSFSELQDQKIKFKETFETFLNVGKKNDLGVEKKHNTIDIRQFHAVDLGFMLNDNEMEYDYIPDSYQYINDLPEKYVCLHVSNTWPSRTYSQNNWQKIINILNNNGISVVLVGKNSSEQGFYNIDKPVQNLKLLKGLDLTNKLSLSQVWHVINKSDCFITMDSGLLHLAGATDTFIVQLGSSINNKLRAPYRNGSQDYKYKYISGSCDIFCASDIKYGAKEWNTIQGVPPLINCLENKNSFECHPSSEQIVDFLKTKIDFKNDPKKFLFITGHLSTGGAPKYLEWLIKQKAKENIIIKVIEWNLYSEEYNVQRKEIINFVGQDNFITIGHYSESEETFKQKEKIAIDLINEFKPDFIHLNDFSEQFAIRGMSDDFVSFLYSKDRKYKIYETLHDSLFDLKNKKNIPDEFWFCSDYHEGLAKQLNLNYKIVEMEIENKIRPDRSFTLLSLGLDHTKYHVLHVGLFCKNKNQKFITELAKQFIDKPVEFHFIGNLCYFDECEIDKNQKNCRFWGERSDVDKFMSCMDLFIFPSLRELNPISVKEALSWNMKCFVSDLEIFRKKYSDNKNITIISNDNLKHYMFKNLLQTDKNISFDSSDINNIFVSYTSSPKVEIFGNQQNSYNIKFIDQKDNSIKYETNITNNMWCCCSIKYFVNWKIIVTNLSNRFEKIYLFNLEKKSVKIINESSSLGDLISWMPVVDAFQKKHDCIVDFYTCKKDLLKNQYPNINFYNYNEINNKPYYCQYKIGCFSQKDRNLDKYDWQSLSLQGICSSILGIESKIQKTKLNPNPLFNFIKDKYVCIATQSTSQSRYWNNKDGWKKLIDYLHSLGYKVICVDKERAFGIKNSMNYCPQNIDYFVGDRSFDDIINIINKCEFFIGLSSGLSWIADALNKKTIIISGSVSENFEFPTPYRVTNKNVCNGCFNNQKYTFDSGNWLWCPENKNFECSKNISFEIVKKIVDNCIKDL